MQSLDLRSYININCHSCILKMIVIKIVIKIVIDCFLYLKYKNITEINNTQECTIWASLALSLLLPKNLFH